MPWDTAHLGLLLPQIWRALEAACTDLSHPFRFGTFGTAHVGSCALRTLVLREARPSDRQLLCHSDFRAPKIRDIQQQPRVEWLLYHPADKVQLRATGLAIMHHTDAVAREAWRATPLPSRINYCTAALPGSPIDAPEHAWCAPVRPGELTQEQSETGWPNFAVIVTTIDRLEFLQLDSTGNRRAEFAWNGGRFHAAWLVP